MTPADASAFVPPVLQFSGDKSEFNRLVGARLPLLPAATGARLGALKLSIIIPAFNEERLLPATLASVNAARGVFTGRGWATELIVCDNNSTDRTAELARGQGATVVFEPINQIGRARNTGAKAATGDWLLFIDADSQPSPELFATTEAVMTAGRAVAGGSTIRLESGHPTADFVCGLWNCLSRWRRLLAGSFIFVEAVAFRQVGGFSEEFFAGEELDLSKRLHELARQRQREIVILQQHPLLTSARKVRLYSTWEHLRFVLRAGMRPGAALRNRDSCHTWYDGRR